MVKTIDLELLELALWNAYANYAQAPNQRKMRAPTNHDVYQCSDALKAMRNSWSLVRSGEENVSFSEMKARALDGMREQKQWSLATRNLYSSAISAYMSWDRGRLTIRPATRSQLEMVRAVGKSIMEELNANSKPNS